MRFTRAEFRRRLGQLVWVRYWWVNHKQTVRQEIEGGYLWSPKRTKDDRRSQFYDNMIEAKPGDGILSFADAQIRYVGRVTAKATEGLKPPEYGPAGENWNNVGWHLPVEWLTLPQPVCPKTNIAELRDWLPKKYSPIRATGDGNQGAYLSEIPQELFRFLVALGGGDEIDLWTRPASPVSGEENSAGPPAIASVNEGYTPFEAPDSPSILVYMINLLETLRAFGGSGTSDEVCDWFITQGVARPSDLEKIQKHGETRFRKEVRFARLALAQAGLLSGNDPGQWRLSPRGWTTDLDLESARAIANRRPAEFDDERDGSLDAPEIPPDLVTVPGPTRGPAPIAWEGIVQRPLATEASTYVMRFGTTSIWKIGHTSNMTARLAELNRHVPVEVLNCRWQLVLERKWDDPLLAYEMEQRLLRELVNYRTTGERVSCTEGQLGAAWEGAKS